MHLVSMRCENCGNDSAKAFVVSVAGEEHVFDSFECAINALAPKCAHCTTKIIGHGIEQGEQTFCCAHCAQSHGLEGLLHQVG